MMWQVGIIGAGDYGAQHAQALAEISHVQVAAASRRDAQALQAFVQQFGGAPYTDYHDLLDDARVQAVVIATPHNQHTEIALAAANAGKHILLEKPIAPTREECAQIIDAVERAQIAFSVGHVNHFVPAYQVAKQIIEAEEIGEIVMGTATMQKYWMVPTRRDWHLDRSRGGGVWYSSARSLDVAHEQPHYGCFCSDGNPFRTSGDI